MKLSRLLVDALVNRGTLTREEIQALAHRVEDRLKLKNILTQKELNECSDHLHNLKIPTPRSWAEAGWWGTIRREVETFSSERVYGECGLQNLKAALAQAGVQDRTIFRKLDNAAKLAEEYEVD